MQVISYATGYSSLMSQIKSQYDQVIASLERSREERIYLRGKMMQLTNSSTTLSNYQRRADDLQTKYNAHCTTIHVKYNAHCTTIQTKYNAHCTTIQTKYNAHCTTIHVKKKKKISHRH